MSTSQEFVTATKLGAFGRFEGLAEPHAPVCSGPTEEDCRLDAEKPARLQSPKARTMLELRKVGLRLEGDRSGAQDL